MPVDPYYDPANWAKGYSPSTPTQKASEGYGPLSPAEMAKQAAAGGGNAANEALFSRMADIMNNYYNQSLTDDRAAQAFSQEMARQQLALDQQKQALAERGEAWGEKTDIWKATNEAAQLATGPTGAIQLAYMARGQGAPQEQIASIFQNLPFVKALLAGQSLPGFGVPEQLGGASPRVDTKGGGTFGLTLPAMNSVTEHQMSGMSKSEQQFLGALYQGEFGIPSEEALTTISNSFVPTSDVHPVSIGR